LDYGGQAKYEQELPVLQGNKKASTGLNNP
jgi:hypothetical protein